VNVVEEENILDEANSTASSSERHMNLKDKLKHMTNEEIASWIDSQAKWVFPLCFVVFNVLYWIFASRLDCTIFRSCGDQDNEDFFEGGSQKEED